jgi:hypothetical protein
MQDKRTWVDTKILGQLGSLPSIGRVFGSLDAKKQRGLSHRAEQTIRRVLQDTIT